MELYNRGVKYLETNPLKAVQFFKKALREKEFKEGYLNLGNAYKLVGNDPLAVKSYLLAASKEVPYYDGSFAEYPSALNNLGLAAYKQGDDAAAIALYNKCLSIDHTNPEAIWNYSAALLRQGFSGHDIDWAAVWKMFSYRFKRKVGKVEIDRTIGLWDGISHVPVLVVLAEQGLGDKIQYGRHLYHLLEYTDRLVVQCPSILDGLFPYETCRSGVGKALPDAVGVPFCSLAGRFDPEMNVDNKEWLRGKFEAKDLGPGYKIGVVWGGSTTHANDRNRSCPHGYYKQFSKFGDLYSLNPAAVGVEWAKDSTARTWKETAEIVLGLDLVIAVDTSIVHLCGSLGVECWMMQPVKETDFRWGLGVEKSLLYDSVRVIPNTGDWETTCANVCKLLGARVVQND